MKVLTTEEYLDLPDEEAKLKYCYDWCVEVDWDKNKLDEVAKPIRVISITVIKKGIKYASEYLNISKEQIIQFRAKYNKNNINSKYNSVIEKLIILTDEEEILELLKPYDVIKIKYKVNSFIRIHKKELSKEERESLEKSILKKLEPALKLKDKEKEKRKQQKLEKEKIKREKEIALLVEDLFTKIINREVTIDEVKSKIGNKKFNNYLEVLKTTSITLYNKYKTIEEEQNNLKEKEYKRVEIIAKELANLIINGIEEDDGTRIFDIIDFYSIFNVQIEEILNVLKNNKNFTREEEKVLKTFLITNIKAEEPLNSKEIEVYINAVDEINCQKNENGFPIPNTGIKISKEEKENLFNYMREKSIPINNKTYSEILKKYKIEVLKRLKSTNEDIRDGINGKRLYIRRIYK